MKRSTLTLFIALCSLSSFAQPRKGTWMVGADIVPIRPKLGYFISNKFQVGTSLYATFSRPNSSNGSFLRVSIAPNARYYFVKKEGVQVNRLTGFLNLDLDYDHRFILGGDNINDRSIEGQLDAGIGAGLLYMVTPNVSLDMAVVPTIYNMATKSSASITTRYKFGVQIYLKNKKKSMIKKIRKKQLKKTL